MNCYYCGKYFECTDPVLLPPSMPLIAIKEACPDCLGAAATLLNNRRAEFELQCAERERQGKLNAVTIALNGEQVQELRRILRDFIVDLAPHSEFVSSGIGTRETCRACHASATRDSYRSRTDPTCAKDKPLTHQADCTYAAAERWFKDLWTQLEETSGAKVVPDLGGVFKVSVPAEISKLTPEQMRGFYDKR